VPNAGSAKFRTRRPESKSINLTFLIISIIINFATNNATNNAKIEK
jgi:hypothetical protein